MKKIEVTPDPVYITADEHAVSFEEIVDLLKDDSIALNEDFDLLHNVTKRIEHFGVYVEEYEQKISTMRNLIEKAYPYLTLNTYKQNVPKKTIRDFKEVMTDVSAWVRRNKNDRQ
tara:strand:+ start:621 stop:965 length:345 start_codon:yes stop_codon:yes gene_type:complete